MGAKEFRKLLSEDSSMNPDCALCRETKFKVGEKTGYGVIIYRIGSAGNGWFATLSPKTGGSTRRDFTIQLMPLLHLTHFSRLGANPQLARNFGTALSELCKAITLVMMKNENLLAASEQKSKSVPIAIYGKSTTWKEKKEHLHIKIFQFRGSLGQPHTVDSSFGKKRVFRGKEGNFVKMKPVKKADIEPGRIGRLARHIIELLRNP